jgi:hypothetical protein
VSNDLTVPKYFMEKSFLGREPKWHLRAKRR